MWKHAYDEIANLIQDSLPGRGIWMRTVPIEDGHSGEGLAIRGGDDAWLVVYFRLLPAAVGPDGAMIGGERAADWNVEVGYEAGFEGLEEAKAEALALLGDLPEPEFEEAEHSQMLSRIMIGSLQAMDFEDDL